MRQEKLLAAKLQGAVCEDAQAKTLKVYSFQAGQTGRLNEEKGSFTTGGCSSNYNDAGTEKDRCLKPLPFYKQMMVEAFQFSGGSERGEKKARF